MPKITSSQNNEDLYRVHGWLADTPAWKRVFTTEFDGELDIDRASDGRDDCFSSIQSLPIESRKKTIIISTFLFDIVLSSLQRQILDFLAQALQDDFNIYITTIDGFKKILTIDELRLENLKITPLHPKQVQLQAASLGIAAKECVILNGHKLLELSRALQSHGLLSLLINEDRYLHYQFFPKEFQLNPSSATRQSLTVFDELGFVCNKLPYPDELAPFITFLELPETMDENAIEELLTHNLSNLKHLDIKSVHITETQFEKLILQASKLKTLTISRDALVSLHLHSIKVNFPVLEQLDLKMTDITAQQLSILLANAPQLKILILTGAMKLDFSQMNMKEINLSALENLVISRASNIASLLTSAPNLINLSLGNFNAHNFSAFDFGHVNLVVLESLTLANSDISTEQLAILLAKTPHLKKLDLNYCRNIDFSQLNLTHVRLNKLESLCLNNTSISAEQLALLLMQTPHLKSLGIAGCNNINFFDLDLTHVNLSKIEELYLSSTAITFEQLLILLSKTSSFKILDIAYNKNLINSRNDFSEINLSSIAELNLMGSSITGEQLSTLLAKSSQIKKLNLSACCNIDFSKLDYCVFQRIRSGISV